VAERTRLRVLAVVGTRPNIMKTAPVLAELGRRGDRFEPVLVHTGQHYDERMSQVFLDQLGVKPPDHVLGVGSGSHAEQTARVMERLEPVLIEERPDLVLVPGDVNSTLAAALTAVKLGLPVAHLEAGLRSFDRSMPEEVNRVLTDAVASLHFTHSPEARTHLVKEGIDEGSIHEVGNTMIDTLFALRDRAAAEPGPEAHGLAPQGYVLVTLHRPALVDGPLLLEAVERLGEVARVLPVIFPVHPRTAAMLAEQAVAAPAGVTLMPPIGYLEFVRLMESAAAVLTDSGGVQEETTALGVPCFTLRANTERPVTVELGTNTLLGLSPARIAEIPQLLAAQDGGARIPPLWDGQASVRVADVLETLERR
jgi:UDP-N-acetylglucosamine 2-epimerase (non-hydrolysing)